MRRRDHPSFSAGKCDILYITPYFETCIHHGLFIPLIPILMCIHHARSIKQSNDQINPKTPSQPIR